MYLNQSQKLKRSFWFEQAEPNLQLPQGLTGCHGTDIAIIGGGFVGLWTAFNIKKRNPALSVTILEQDLCGAGASGRNGGMAMSWWPKISTLLSFCSTEQALFLANSAEQAIHDLGQFCIEHKIHANFKLDGWLWTATTPKHVDSWKSTLAACEKLGVAPFEYIAPTDVAKQAGSDIHLAGVFEKSNATLQPAILARGLRDVVLKLGVKIFEQTPVQEFFQQDTIMITTEAGEVHCKKLVLATNAWSSSIPELAAMITPVNSALIATERIPDELNAIGLTTAVGITDCQLMVDYYRTTTDGRLVFGKGTGALSYNGNINNVFSEHQQSIEMTTDDFKRTYPQLADKKITHQWTGPIDRTYDSLPVFGNLKDQPNIFYGIGWSGNGVSPSQIGGKILASLALGCNDEWSSCSLVNRQTKKFPPEPFRYIGGNWVRNAVIRKERAEMRNQNPSCVDVMIAKFAPAGLEDKS